MKIKSKIKKPKPESARNKNSGGWYMTFACQKMEKSADKDIKAGRIKRCHSAELLKMDLRHDI
jgi:hypothetical protein